METNFNFYNLWVTQRNKQLINLKTKKHPVSIDLSCFPLQKIRMQLLDFP